MSEPLPTCSPIAGQVPEGVDLAVLKMKKGETAEVTIAPKYAFGAKGAQRQAGAVPADATVVYTVTLKDFENVGHLLLPTIRYCRLSATVG